MNAPVNVMERHQQSGKLLGMIDCDVHPFPRPGAKGCEVPVRVCAMTWQERP